MKSHEIVKVFAEIRDEKTMSRFFEEMFTPAEIHDLVLRWELMKRLKQGMPQRKIAADLGISLCKITRGAKIVHNRKSVVNQMLEKQVSPVSEKAKQR